MSYRAWRSSMSASGQRAADGFVRFVPDAAWKVVVARLTEAGIGRSRAIGRYAVDRGFLHQSLDYFRYRVWEEMHSASIDGRWKKLSQYTLERKAEDYREGRGHYIEQRWMGRQDFISTMYGGPEEARPRSFMAGQDAGWDSDISNYVHWSGLTYRQIMDQNSKKRDPMPVIRKAVDLSDSPIVDGYRELVEEYMKVLLTYPGRAGRRQKPFIKDLSRIRQFFGDRRGSETPF
jgi:hypothetical protein